MKSPGAELLVSSCHHQLQFITADAVPGQGFRLVGSVAILAGDALICPQVVFFSRWQGGHRVWICAMQMLPLLQKQRAQKWLLDPTASWPLSPGYGNPSRTSKIFGRDNPPRHSFWSVCKMLGLYLLPIIQTNSCFTQDTSFLSLK